MFLLYFILSFAILGAFAANGQVSPLTAQIWALVTVTVSALVYCFEGPRNRK